MGTSRAVAAVLIAAILPATALADRLVDAYLRGDEAEVARAGRRASASGLEPAMVSPDRPTALAAIAAAPAAEDAWQLLLFLADLAGGPDRPVAQAAAHSATRIADSLDATVLSDRDIPRDSIAIRVAAWSAIAGRDDRWADVRVLALQISQRLAHALDPAALGYDLDEKLTDLDPEIRRAALELLPSPPTPAQLSRAGRAAAEDPDSIVAIVAAQAACSGLAFDDAPAPILDALSERAIARVQAAVTDASLPVMARVDAARCLATEGSPASMSAVKKLAASAPAALRAELRAMSKGRR